MDIDTLKAEIQAQEEALERLYAQRRAIMVAQYRSGMSMRAIAPVWGISQVAVNLQLQKAAGSPSTASLRE